MEGLYDTSQELLTGKFIELSWYKCKPLTVAALKVTPLIISMIAPSYNIIIVNIYNAPCLSKMTLLAQLYGKCIIVGIRPSSNSRKKVKYI